MDYKILNFVSFCVGSVADTLKMSAKDVYQRMSKGGIISDYIVPCYDVLHTFSREYIVEDLVDLMNKKGLLTTAWDSIYNSTTFELISEGVADMHCLSDEYLAEELLIELKKEHSS